jgi:hypothetical protein
LTLQHDGTLLALLSALRVKSHPSKMPPFAACIIMELYQQEDGGLFVEVSTSLNGNGALIYYKDTFSSSSIALMERWNSLCRLDANRIVLWKILLCKQKTSQSHE